MLQGLGDCALDRVRSKTIADSAENVSLAVRGPSFNLRNSSRSRSSHRNGEGADCPGTSQSAEVDKREARKAPIGTKILLAQESTPQPSSRACNQTNALLFLFLHADDFLREHIALTRRGA